VDPGTVGPGTVLEKADMPLVVVAVSSTAPNWPFPAGATHDSVPRYPAQLPVDVAKEAWLPTRRFSLLATVAGFDADFAADFAADFDTDFDTDFDAAAAEDGSMIVTRAATTPQATARLREAVRWTGLRPLR